MMFCLLCDKFAILYTMHQPMAAVLNLWVSGHDPRGSRLMIYWGSAGTFTNFQIYCKNYKLLFLHS